MVKQLNLFSQQSLNVGKSFKEALARAVKENRHSREELLERINDLASRYGVRMMKGNGRGLTMATFEKWLNPEALDYMPPINALVIICGALGDMSPLQEIIAPLGGMLIDENEVKMLLWAKEYHLAKEARSRMRKLEAEL